MDADYCVKLKLMEERKAAMLRLSMKPGQQLNIGDDIKVIYKRRNAQGITVILDAPKDLVITRNGLNPNLPRTEYYRDSWQGKKPVER